MPMSSALRSDNNFFRCSVTTAARSSGSWKPSVGKDSLQRISPSLFTRPKTVLVPPISIPAATFMNEKIPCWHHNLCPAFSGYVPPSRRKTQGKQNRIQEQCMMYECPLYPQASPAWVG